MRWTCVGPYRDVESYDGRGRREIFKKKPGEDGGYEAPAGRFVELSRTSAGWVWIDAQKNQRRFDRFGRLVAIADAVKDSAETGNEMRFHYDAAGHLVEIEDTLERSYFLDYDDEGRLTTLTDFDGREVTYEYDPEGRLVRVLSPEVTTGIESPSRLTTTYAYEPATGALTGTLNTRDNLTSVTDPRGVEWLTNTYTDADGDGRAEEVTGQTWGGDELSVAYDLTARTAAVTDREGGLWSYQHDAEGHPTQLTDPANAVTAMAYDAEGLVTSVTEPLGRVTTTTYDIGGGRRSRGNATEVTVTADGRGPNGSAASLTTAITYEPRTNLPATVTDPRGAVTTYTRDAAGLPTTIARPEGATTAMEYNDFGQVTKVTNPNGHVTTYAYFSSGDAEGYLRQEIVDPGGLALTTRYEVDPRGNVTAVTDPRGTRHTTEYNELDWTVTEVAAAGTLNYTTTYAFDAAGQVTKVQEPYSLGTETAATRTTYGPLGEVLSVARDIEPTGTTATTSYAYDANRNPTRVTDPNGNVTTTLYDARNLAQSRTMGEGTAEAITESFTYDLEGRLLTRTDGRSNVWTREHDGYGRLAASVDPLGNRSETEYDDGGNVTETRRLGAGGTLLAKSGATYDLLGRPTTRTEHLWTSDPGSARALTTTTAYDPAGNVLSVTDPLSRTTAFTYDAAERQLTRTDPIGNEVRYQLDAGGQPEAVTLTEVGTGGGAGAVTTTTHEYDPLGREIASADPLGNTTRRILDAQGRARLVTDPEGFSTERVYDSLGRMLTETLPEGIRTEMAYDAKGNRTSYRDALGNTTTWAHDALDRVTAVTYPDATTESTGYDGAGNPTTITQPSGTVVTQTHDGANRLTARTISPAAGVEGPTTESYQYDGLDRLTQAVSGTGPGAVTSTRTYDSLSRVTSEATAGRTISYALDDAGNVTGITYPSGATVTRQLDSLDRLEAVPGVASYGYRGPDLVTEKTLGALSGTMAYDGARRPVRDQLTSPVGWNVFDEQLAWSPRDLKVGIGREDTGSGLRLAHDGAGRLLQAERTATLPTNNSAPAPSGLTTGFGYTYDAAQNLLARSESDSGVETVTTMPLDGSGRNRPGAIDGQSLGWDAQGNLTQKGDLHFHYDYRNRLTRVTDSVGTEMASYTYDAFNRRIAKSAGGTTEETAWAGWQALERYEDGQLAERRTYGMGLDEIVRLESDLDGDGTLEQSYTPVYDATGNLALVADATTGQVVERYRFDPYGERTILVDSTPPVVEQLRVKDGALWLEVSEGVNAEALQAAVTAGAVTLTDTATSTAVGLTATQPVQEGRQAFRRIVLSPDAAPAEGTALELRIEPAALRDPFGNPLAVAYVQSFPWPAGDPVLDDTEAPEVHAVRLVDRFVEIELTEEPDLDTVTAAVTVDGQGLAWTLGADRYTVRSTEALAAGGASLSVATTLADLAATTLAQALTEPVPATEQDATLFGAPDPRESFASTIGNRAGFHGLDHDDATGLLYVRNRWLDPELARWTSVDPIGFADGPSGYQAFLNSPLDERDPLGLLVRTGPRELDVIQLITTRLGYPELASTLFLNQGEVEIERSRILDWARVVKKSKPLWFLFRVLREHRVLIDLSFVRDPELEAHGGAKTTPVSYKRGEFYHSKITLDPMIVENVRLRLNAPDLKGGAFDPALLFLEGWADTPLDVAVLHEFGHAFGAFDLNLVSGYQVRGLGPTDEYAVEREDEYRSVLGLPLRGTHSAPAVYCPGGSWGSELCMQKMWCKVRGYRGDYCATEWSKAMPDLDLPNE